MLTVKMPDENQQFVTRGTNKSLLKLDSYLMIVSADIIQQQLLELLTLGTINNDKSRGDPQ